MAVTKLIEGLPTRTMTQEAFDAAMAKLMADLPAWAGEVNITAAGMTAAAAGGAFAIPYAWGSGINTGPYSQASTIILAVTNVCEAGWDAAPILGQFNASSSLIKGQVRVVSRANPLKFVVFTLTSRDDQTTYQVLNGSILKRNGGDFATGEGVFLFFDRTGDKGDTGLPYMRVTDRKASGTHGGVAITGLQTRVLNTVEFNSIPGAALAGNTVYLPGGAYQIRGFGAACRVKGHQAQLWNTTDNAYEIAGSSAYANAGADVNTNSEISGRLVFAVAKSFQLRHAIESGADSFARFGLPSSPGGTEIYSALDFIKIA